MRRKSRKSTHRNFSGVSNTPSGTFSPLRSASFWISAGGTVPSRWTCSSASGEALHTPARRTPSDEIARGSHARGWLRRSDADGREQRRAASSALESPRAWTIASGRSGPTSAPIGATSDEPDAVVDLVVLAAAVAAEAGDDEADGARVDALRRSPAARAPPAVCTEAVGSSGFSTKSLGPPSAATIAPKRSAALPSSSTLCTIWRAPLVVRRQLRLHERGGGERDGHLVQPRLARARRSGSRPTRAPRARCRPSSRAPRPCR